MKCRRLLFPCTLFLSGYIFHYCQKNFLNATIPTSKSISVNNLKNQNAFLVIFVLSSLRNLERRGAIRETWGKDLKSSIRLYFVINAYGISPETNTSLTSEQKSYGDLLIFHDIEDTFYSLTSTVLHAFMWVTNRMPNVKVTAEKSFTDFAYILKCDDDSYVRVDSLEQQLRNVRFSNEKLYWGFFDGRAKVKKSGKYKEMGWNICDTYIPYALGGGYVLGREPVAFIASNSQYLKKYQSEDTSIGAWLANFEGLKREHDPRFDTEYLSRGCHQSYLVTHKHEVEGLRRIYKNLQETGEPCSKEYRTRLSYRYNWNVIPSKCCARNNPTVP